jgi:hypothetical protein
VILRKQQIKSVIGVTMAVDDDATRRRRRHLTTSRESLLPIPTGNASPERRNKKKRRKDTPFYVLWLQVAITFVLICIIFLAIYQRFVPSQAETIDDVIADDDSMVYQQQQEPKLNGEAEKGQDAVEADAGLQAPLEQEAPAIETPPPLPIFNLTEMSSFDAFALAERYQSKGLFWQAAEGLRTSSLLGTAAKTLQEPCLSEA